MDSSKRVFLDGEYVGARFRIVKFLASGGMGEVYEADDLELGERVALKTIKPEVARDPQIMSRFKKEIQLARKVTHPNVCRVFDLAVHNSRDAGEVSFLSMELLDGETLTSFLKRSGPLKPIAALPLIRQIVAGLAAAHDVGIVHRDLKSANVMLMAPEGAGASRAVLTDFGLARRDSQRPDEATLTDAHEFAGTPSYMAPEQVAGRTAGPAADQYALGVLMFEMLTGRLPFEADTPLAVALKRLHIDPPSPRKMLPDIEDKWEKTILRCLEKRPEDRFQNIGQVVETLGGNSSAKERSRWQAGAAVALMAMSLAGGWFWYAAGRPAPKGLRRSVAMMGFRNLSGRPEEQWLSTALAEMLSAELGQVDKLRLLPGEAIARAKTELGLTEMETYNQETLKQVARNLQTDILIGGSYALVGEPRQLRLNLHLQEVSTGEVIQSVSSTGREAELFDLVSDAGRQLRETLSPGSNVSLAKGRSANLAATRNYAEGLNSLRRFDSLSARESFMKSIAADPQFALAHASLSEAHAALGFEAKAREEAGKAFELASELPRADRLLIEGRYREATKDWNGAERVYETLAKDYPDEPEHKLRLVTAMTRAGRGEAALALIAKLPSGDPRTDLAEAAAAETINDFRRVGEASRRTIADAQKQGAMMAEARGWTLSGVSRFRLGDPQGALTDYEKAGELYRRIGDEGGLSRVYNNIGGVLLRAGDSVGAAKQYENSLAIKRKIGDARGIGMTLGNLALIARNNGKLTEAMKLLEERLQSATQMGERAQTTFAWQNIQQVREARGQFDKALEANANAEAGARAMGAKQDLGIALMKKGQLYAETGRVIEAGPILDEAIQIERSMGASFALVNMLAAKAEWQFMRAQLREAEATYGEARMIVEKRGVLKERAEIDLGMAELRLEQDRPADAEKLLRKMLEDGIGTIAVVQGTLAKALAAQHRDREASALALEAERSDPATECLKCGWDVGLLTAPFLGAKGPALLRAALEQMQTGKAVYRETEARRILANLLRRARNIVSAAEEDKRADELARKYGYTIYAKAR